MVETRMDCIKMKKKITVIVPLYNQEKFIGQCLESILKQNLPNISVIVVNDGSTDRSLEICRGISKNDLRLTIITQENQGLAGARYTGIKAAKSEYITFVDADDFILPNAFNKAVKYMENGYDMIFFEISRFFNENKIKMEHHVLAEGTYDKIQIEREVYPKLVWNFERKTPGIECSQCVKIVKKSLLTKAYEALENNRFYYGEDIAISYPMFTYINSLAVVCESYYMHRQRINNEIPSYIRSDKYFKEVYFLCDFLRKKMSECEYDFNTQIDYLYMYSVELKKMCYGEYFYKRDFVFPFDKVDFNKQIVLYGAGDMGRTYYEQLSKIKYCKQIIWVDENAEYIENLPVKTLDVLNEKMTKEFEFVVIAIDNKEIVEGVKKFLVQIGYDEDKIVY